MGLFFIGTRNEINVREHLPDFLKHHSRNTIKIMQIKEFGLLCCKDFPTAAFSPDGICAIKLFVTNENCDTIYRSYEFLALLEIKTKTTDNTAEREWQKQHEIGSFVEINLTESSNSTAFANAIPEVNFRAQILHGMGCSKLQSAFYVVASDTNIIRVVHVWFHDLDPFYRRYQRVIKDISTREQIDWICNGRAPIIDASEFKKTLKYAVDQHTAFIFEARWPEPYCRRLGPTIFQAIMHKPSWPRPHSLHTP